MASFPLANKQDSALFNFDTEDVGIRSEMEGGYVLTRPRHTRTPRKIFTTGFTDISDADKLTFDTFWNTHGTFLAFDYTDPIGGTLYNVRFQQKPQWEFAGWPGNPRWNIKEVLLEEV